MQVKEMQQIKVFKYAPDSIAISQEDVVQHEPVTITIHPDQVDILVKWLLYVKKEMVVE